jgi:integrase
VAGPIFANLVGHPLDLNACYQREMKDVLKRAEISWHGWHGFRRGLASNLNRLGVDDSVVQRILRHSTVATTQNHYIKTALPDAIAAMKQLSDALLCSTFAPGEALKVKGSVQ